MGSYVGSALRRAVAVPIDALLILARHWPALLTVMALGLGLRQLVIWLAVIVSDYSPLAAALIVPLAPIVVMTSLISALWLVKPSLPYVSKALASPAGGVQGRMLTIGGLLIPFLTVYASNGLLKEDTREYIYNATLAEASSRFLTADFGRVNFEFGWLLISLVLVSLVVRKLIGVFALGEKSVGWAGLSAYLEVLWMVTFSTVLTTWVANGREWLASRAVIAPVVDTATNLREWSLELAGPVGAILSWIVTLLARADDVIIIPVAWLTLGATIYGTSLVVPSATKKKKGGAHAKDGPRQFSELAVMQARSTIDTAAKPIIGPLKVTWSGLTKVAAAGLAPMVTFCVLFIMAKAAEVGVLYGGRMLLGPRPMTEAAAIHPYIEIVGRMVYFMVAIVLIAPAIDRLLAATAPEEGPTQAPVQGPVELDDLALTEESAEG
ncbi:hypothetical protein CATRI_09360 [Corynebacterium atrinae]|uniref:hypothetical protein n=1 Tax=Corynebacterium atrinae TaxID=1336740 RepID=UPI0025B5A856|nr:hypothetical protein [Corynebacterium atrinae]WJY63940.1 hypothetical protein CATRI_09360 [Corynebacterium atrinae]